MSASTVRRAGIRLSLEGAQEVTRDLQRLGETGERSLAEILRSATAAGNALRLLGPLSGVLSLAGVAAGFRRATQEAQEFERLGLRTEAVLRATGNAAGIAARDIREMSQTIARETLASTRGVEQAAQKLLTYTGLAPQFFERTLRAAQDLAAVGYGSIESAVESLGRALENPEQGLAALTRQGYSFSQTQRQLIADLVATGQAAEAQRIILDTVESTVGGAGRAEAGGFAGAYDTLAQNVQNFLTTVGNLGPVQAATAALNGLAAAVAAADGVVVRAAGGEDPRLRARRQLGEAERDVANLRGQLSGVDQRQLDQLTIRGGLSRQQAMSLLAPSLPGSRARDIDAELQAAIERQALAQTALVAAEDEYERERALVAIRGRETREANERDAAETALTALREQLDRRIAVERTYQTRLAVIQRNIAAGTLTDDGAGELRARAAAERDRALAALVPQTPTGRTTPARDDGLAELLRNRETLVRRNETAAERYNRQVAELDRLVAGLIARGPDNALPDVVVQRERTRLLEEFNRSLETTDVLMQELGRFAERAFERIGRSLTQMAMEGRSSFEGLRNIGKAVVSELLQEFYRLAVMNPLRNMINGGSLPTLGDLAGRILGAFSPFSGIPSTAGALAGTSFTSAGVPIIHTGGIAGGTPPAMRTVPMDLFRDAPRLHRGGFIGPDEVPAILQRGEGVFTPDQMRAMGPAGGTVIHVTFQGGDMGREADRNAMVEQMRAVIRQEIDGRAPSIIRAAHGYSVSQVQRGGMAAREFGRR